MSTIPLSVDFRVTPNVVTPAGTALDANGLVLTDNELIPVGQVAEFTNSASIAELLGTDAPEYKAAQLYFSGYSNSSVTPGKLMMSRVITAAVAGWLLSGSLKGVPIATLKAIPAGTITLDVDGAPVTSASIDLSTATSYSDIATKVQTGIGPGVTVTWNSIAQRFLIKSATTGATSSVSAATAGALATGLKLTTATAATTSPGSAPVAMTAMMNSIVDQNQGWVLFSSLTELSDANKTELCAWASASNNRYGYVVHDPSATALVPNNAACFNQAVVVANGYENVFPVYGTYLYAIPALAYAASLDFARTGGRVTYKFRDFPGLAPNVSDRTSYDALVSNGYNFYGSYSLNQTMARYTSDGAISGKFPWLDSWVSQVWMNANLVGAFVNLFQNNASYSFNQKGYSAVSAAVIDVANQGKNFGAIQTGVTLDAAQIAIINGTVGKNIANTLYSEGWYLFIPTQTGAARLERDLKGVIFYYVDGGMIQSIDMSSTAIL